VLDWFLTRGDPEERMAASRALDALAAAAASADARPRDVAADFPFPVDASAVAQENFGSDLAGDRKASRGHLKRALRVVELATGVRVAQERLP
jgi:hypothetical protein